MYPKKVVGQFGIKGDDGNQHIINWVVTPRKDRRHGFVDKQGHFSNWHKRQLEDMFKGWK